MYTLAITIIGSACVALALAVPASFLGSGDNSCPGVWNIADGYLECNTGCVKCTGGQNVTCVKKSASDGLDAYKYCGCPGCSHDEPACCHSVEDVITGAPNVHDVRGSCGGTTGCAGPCEDQLAAVPNKSSF